MCTATQYTLWQLAEKPTSIRHLWNLYYEGEGQVEPSQTHCKQIKGDGVCIVDL